MTRGGARNRSGPQPDETSLKSAKIGYVLTALPAAGYDGPVPEFPLPKVIVWWEHFEDKQKVREVDDNATEARRERELALWEWVWRTPQACAWSSQPWRWHSVAMWVRTSALCESAEATAADKNSLHRFADQIGLTPAGLKENGWKVAEVEAPEAKRPAVKKAAAPARKAARDRFQVIDGAAG
ncbi:hypothetical protein EYA84_02090 [Verrucosispora sp. SN26_14.1]|uniref:hypothetical protein n=1 Tax=Verrucosispora sp. SN26_14.1 TaxID=2527879 RepID=UPI0010346528|nr:hypothetical protein [Verrucosispora sp. SN26_14.1]TBL44254.1 hypothetical protein EYA84_02090 [Verrucosispora sp. SN26_14.1]